MTLPDLKLRTKISHRERDETGPDKPSGFIKNQPTSFKKLIRPEREDKTEKDTNNTSGWGQIP